MSAKKSEDLRILQVRNKRSSIFLSWMNGTDEFKVTFHDNPLPSFYKALAALPEHVCALCEFSPKDAAKIDATGITVAEKGDNSLALIVAKKKVKKGGRVFNIATPLLAMYPDDENKDADCMDKDTAAAIEKVIKEAKKYIGGDRAQGQIVFETAEEKATDEKTGAELPFETPEAAGNA